MAVGPKSWSGASGNVPVATTGGTLYGFNYNNTTAGTVVTFYDNATTNSGTILFQATLAATTADTVTFVNPIRFVNGVTINATAAVGAAGAVYVG